MRLPYLKYCSFVSHLLDIPRVLKVDVKQNVSSDFCATWCSSVTFTEEITNY